MQYNKLFLKTWILAIFTKDCLVAQTTLVLYSISIIIFQNKNVHLQERTVGPGQYAVVRVLVRAGAQVGETQGHVTLRTQYETIQIAAHMRVEHGSLQVTPDPIVFNDCFPVSN